MEDYLISLPVMLSKSTKQKQDFENEKFQREARDKGV